MAVLKRNMVCFHVRLVATDKRAYRVRRNDEDPRPAVRDAAGGTRGVWSNPLAEKPVKARRVKLATFQPATVNPNKGNVNSVPMIVNSITMNGAGRPMLADKAGEMVAGSHALQAFIDAGFDEAIVIEGDGTTPVIFQRTDVDINSAQGRSLQVGDNVIGVASFLQDDEVTAALLNNMAAEDARLVQAAGFDDADVRALMERLGQGNGKEDPGAQVDRAGELQQKWNVERGDLWTIGKHRLLCGDSTNADDVARLMGGEKADAVFTSPPYAVGVDYGEYDDTIANLRAMLPKLAALWLSVVVDGGFAVINYGDIAPARNITGTDEPCEYPMAVEYWPVFRAAGWLLWSRRIWCKPTPRVHSPWCIQSNRAATDFEHLWTWRKPGTPIMKRVDGEFSSVNGWYQSSHLPGVDEGKDIHGAGMATGIAQWMLTTHSRFDSVILEPFGGSGTTMVACEQLSRQCRMIEIEPKYCAVILERMSGLGLEPKRVS